MNLSAYSRYRPSGVDWLGDVPEHWEPVRIASVSTKITNGYVGPTRDILVDEGVRYLQSLHIKDNSIKFDEKYYVTKEWSEEHNKSILRQGDVLVVQTGDIGQVACVAADYEGCNCHALIIVSPLKRKLDGAFLSLFLHSTYGFHALKRIQTGALHPHLNCTFVREIKFPLPPPAEQRSIVDFLNMRIGKIDTLTRKKEELIEKLQEKRLAVISRTVTRGLPPEAAKAAGLNPHPKMKDSGIEWIGEIPEHWGTRRLRHISDRITVGVVVNPSSYVSDEGVPFLLGGDVREFVVDISDSNRCLRETSDGPLRKSRLSPGDLVVVRVGYPGVAAVIPPELDGANCASMMIVRRHRRFCSQWLAYLFNSQSGRDQVEIVQYGAAQKQFNISHAVDFSFPFPPLPEQDAIADYLDRETANLDRMSEKIKAAIEKLTEYRSALVTAAVTGKIDVRNHAGD